jgi:hypothetical protein
VPMKCEMVSQRSLVPTGYFFRPSFNNFYSSVVHPPLASTCLASSFS